MTASEKRRRRVRLPLWRYSSFWMSLAGATFVVSTAATLMQSPRDPYERLRLDSVRGWLTPVDPARARQLPSITTDLNAVHVAPDDPQKLWVAGNAGTILYSADGGKTWTRQEIVAANEPATAARTGAKE